MPSVARRDTSFMMSTVKQQKNLCSRSATLLIDLGLLPSKGTISGPKGCIEQGLGPAEREERAEMEPKSYEVVRAHAGDTPSSMCVDGSTGRASPWMIFHCVFGLRESDTYAMQCRGAVHMHLEPACKPVCVMKRCTLISICWLLHLDKNPPVNNS